MAVDELLVLRGEGNVDIQIDGPGNNWEYLSSCAHMDGPSVPRGDTEIRWCQDRSGSGSAFVKSTKFRTAPGQVTGTLMTKLGKIDHLDKLDCPFSLRARFAKCTPREDPANFNPLILSYTDVDLTQHGYDGPLAIVDPANQDEIMVNAPWSAAYEYRVKLVSYARAGTLATLGDQAINDIEYCGSATCGGYCGSRKDDCTTIHAVTDTDTTPYAWPNHIQGIKNVVTDVITWYSNPILGMVGNVENVECAGDRLLVAGNSMSAVAYNDTLDDNGVFDQDEWNVVTMTYAPSTVHNALFARTSREIWCGCESGYVAKSTDAGETWTNTNVGTAQTINAVFAYDQDLVFAVGNAGVMFRSSDGGSSWTDITEVATFADNCLVVKVPPGRIQEVYVGTAAGEIYRSTNQGATFSQYNFSGDSVGSVDDIDFAGPGNGDVMWILHNDAGPRARILRDLSGGAGGADVRVEVGYTDLVAAGIDLNALAVCGVNDAIAGGENNGGYPYIVKVS